MSKYTQRLNQHSNIIPSGFAGYIIRNSNVVIDKSYTQKGTTFVNAFDNTNTLIKDCCSPFPSLQSSQSRYQKIKNKLKVEVDYKKFPFWFHYILKRYKNKSNYQNFVAGDDSIKLKVVTDDDFSGTTLQAVKQYRQQMISGAVPTASQSKQQQVPVSSVLQVKLTDNSYDTCNVHFTVSGTYYIDNIWSSIRSVFPLNIHQLTQQDVPQIVLNLKSRQFLTNYISTTDTQIGQPILIKDSSGNYIKRKDKYNNYIVDPSPDKSHYVNIDDKDFYQQMLDLGWQISPSGLYNNKCTHKYIADSSNSKPIYQPSEDDPTQFKPVSLIVDEENKLTKLQFQAGASMKNNVKVYGSKYYFTGPYIASTIGYRAVAPTAAASSTQNVTLKNIDQPLNFYFKYLNNTYVLSSFINGYIQAENSDVMYPVTKPQQMPSKQKQLYYNYLANHVNSTITNALCGVYDKNYKQYVDMDVISSRVNTYQPQNYYEDCQFLGLKYQVVNKYGFQFLSGKFYVHLSGIDSFKDNTDQFVSGYLMTSSLESTEKVDPALNLFNKKFFYLNNEDSTTMYITPMNGIFIDNDKLGNQSTSLLSTIILASIDYTLSATPNNSDVSLSSVAVMSSYLESKEVSSCFNPSLSWSGQTATSYGTRIDFSKVDIGNTTKYNKTNISSYDKEVVVGIAMEQLCYGQNFSYDINDTTGRANIQSIWAGSKFLNTINSEVSAALISSTGSIGKLFKQYVDGNTEKKWRETSESEVSGINNVIRSLQSQFPNKFKVLSGQTNDLLYFNGTESEFTSYKQQINQRTYCSSKYSAQKNTVKSNYSTEATIKVSSIKIDTEHFDFKHLYKQEGVSNVKIQMPQYMDSFSKTSTTGKSFINFTSIDASTQKIIFNGLSGYTQSLYKQNTDTVKSLQAAGYISQNLVTFQDKLGTAKVAILNQNSCSDSEKIFVFPRFLIDHLDDGGNYIDQFKHVNNDLQYQKVYVQYGQLLTFTNVETNNAQIKLTGSESSVSIFIDTDNLLNRKSKDLILFYNEDCSKPLYIQKRNGVYYFIAINNNGKAQYLDGQNSKTVQNNIFISAQYKPLYQFKLLEAFQYKNQFVQDWYDIDTYINCQKFLTTKGAYKVSMTMYHYSDSQYEVIDIDPIKSSFSNISYINTDVTPEGSSVKLDYPYSLRLTDNLTVDSSDSLAKLFSRDELSIYDNQQFAYKLFSFNFKIPKVGWDTFSQQMYKKNQNFGNSLFAKQSLIDTYCTPIDKLNAFVTSECPITSGYFSFIYMVLNSRTAQNIVGTGNYGTGYYSAPSGVIYDPKNPGVIIGYTQNQIQGAYSAAELKNAGVEYDGIANGALSSAYKSHYISIPYIVKLSDGGNILNIVSQNQTLSFSEDISKITFIQNSRIFKKTLTNICVTQTINSIVHNIIIPKLQLVVMMKYDSDKKFRSFLITTYVKDIKVKSLIYNNINFDDNYNNIYGFIESLKLRDADFANFYNLWLLDIDNFQSMRYYLRNMSIMQNLDQNNYPYSYIPMMSINFGTPMSQGGMRTNINQYQSIAWSQLSGYVTLFDKYKPISGSAITYIDITEDQQLTNVGLTNLTYRNSYVTGIGDLGTLIDAQQFVLPTDMSTNLFYYKSSDSKSSVSGININDEDQVMIINARKMYSQIEDLDSKPMDSKLIFDLSRLKDTELTLTAMIQGNEDQISEYFDQVNVAVSSNSLEYSTFEDGTKLPSTQKCCRYTDANSEGIQWNLFKLKSNVTFKSQNIEIPLRQDGPNISSNISGDNINVPVNLSMNLAGLIFQQQCRYGVSFDNINKISFDQRIFDNSVFSNDLINGELSSRFKLKKLGITDMPSAGVSGDFYLIRKMVTELTGDAAFGGSAYFNDYYNMKVNANSANKWKTYQQTSRFSKFLAYPDYNPTQRIVGTPYLNSSKTIKVKQNVYKSEGSIAGTVESLASVAKIAEDIAYVNNINTVASYEDQQKYPSSVMFNYDGTTAELVSSNILLINVSGYIKDQQFDSAIKNNTGIKAFNLEDFTNLDIFKVSGDSTFKQLVDGGRTSFAINFDGFDGQKQVFLYQKNSVFKVENSITKQLEGVNPSYLKVYKITSSTGVSKVGISGTVALTLKNYYSNENNTIQIHNFKMPAPTIQKIGITFTDQESDNLVNGHYYLNSTDLWRPGIVLPKSYSSNFRNLEEYLNCEVSEKLKNRRLYSSSQTDDDFKGNSVVLTDDDGTVTGLMLTLTIPGIRLFDYAGIKFFLQSKKQIILSSQQMVNQYHEMFKPYQLSGSLSGTNYLSAEYNQSAVVGTTVVTGVITNAYNYISSKALSADINVGTLDYIYNPQDDDKFQLEVITKQKNKSFSKILYYINMPVDRWYNMAFYKYVNSSKSITSTEKNIDFGFILSDVNATSITDITSKGQQIFNCQVANDAFVKGTTVKFKLTDSDQLSSALTGTLFKRDDNGKLISCMKDWKSLYTIQFDKYMRTQWDCKYSCDYSKFADTGTLSVDQWRVSSRKNRDLFRIGDTINSIAFTNPYSQVKIFANAELNYALGINSSTKFYDLSDSYLTGGFSNKIDTSTLKNDTTESSKEIRKRLLLYYPYKFLNSDDSQNYVLVKKSDTQKYPIIKAVAAEVSNIMFVSSPNFNYQQSSTYLSGETYVKSYTQSINLINDYKGFFENPQHRLPPVSYEQHILSSDYATLIYNNVTTQIGINDSNYLTNYDQSFVYNYEKSPKRISYVWGNSQVTKVYSLEVSNNTQTQLCWNKAAFTQYQAQIGSVYNFKDVNTLTNSIVIETGSINQRQCVLMPVITSPLEYEKRSQETGFVKVTQNIIATSALGYTKSGQPKNGILTYNTNGCVEIDPANTNYIYIQQNGNGNECILKSTVQKPVYVQSVCDHNQSLSQKYKFLQNPDVSELNNSINGGSYATSKITNTTNVDTFMVPNNSTSQNKRISQFAYCGTSQVLTVQDGHVLTYFNKVARKPQLQYKYQNGFIQLNPKVNQSIQQDNNDIDLYFANPYAMPKKDDLGNIDIEVLNVFADEDYLTSLQTNVGRTSYESTKCFGYDGTVLPSTQLLNNLASANILNNDEYRSFSNYNLKYSPQLGFYKAPMIGVLWGFDGDLASKIDPGSLYYEECLSAELRTTGVAYCDQFRQHNISGVKFKISQANFKSAPTFIRIQLLKYNVTNKKFEWEGNDLLNLDIRATYQQYYNYDSNSDAFIEWDFIDDQLSLCKNTFGIRFIIQQIVPQDKTFNSCKIDNIQIFTSNYLNKYGLARTVEDVFVRKVDANYTDAYEFKCSQYVWRLPNSRSEWQNMLSGLQNDESFVTKNALETIKEGVSGIIDGTSQNIAISSYITNPNLFDQQYSYYIAAKTIYDTPIEILSDNYLVKSNIQISWKYIDYVYIYYSCYSFNAKQLLDMYFGDKIYNAVRNKLIENVENMNSNSLFAGKYKFRGGVAVQKEYELNTTTKSQAFEWKSDVRTDTIDTYQDVYVTKYTKVDQYQYDVYQTDQYKSGNGYGGDLQDPRTGQVVQSTLTNGDEYLSQSTQSASTYYAGTLLTGSTTERNYLGSTLQNTKYMSVDNWMKSFTPRQLKFKIN